MWDCINNDKLFLKIFFHPLLRTAEEYPLPRRVFTCTSFIYIRKSSRTIPLYTFTITLYLSILSDLLFCLLGAIVPPSLLLGSSTSQDHDDIAPYTSRELLLLSQRSLHWLQSSAAYHLAFSCESPASVSLITYAFTTISKGWAVSEKHLRQTLHHPSHPLFYCRQALLLSAKTPN